MIKNKKKGILFWLTGLPGSGKSSVIKKIYNPISKKYGKSLLINGDDIRKIFALTGYEFHDRKRIGLQYSKLFQKITSQNINVLFAGGVLIDDVRKQNRKQIENYVEIYLKSNQKKIISKKFKKIYFKTKNLVGININPEFPKKPHIIIYNDFKKNIDQLSHELINKIYKKVK